MRQLSPFSPFDDVQVFADIRSHERRLVVEYRLEDLKKSVEGSLHPGCWRNWPRADELWRTTCFELFLGVPHKSIYWEFNFSPAKERWNVYAFDGYRRPQPPLPSDDFELSMVEVGDDFLKCELNPRIPLPGVEAALTAVIRTPQGTHYFSLKHTGTQPDFHLRDSFLLKFDR